MSFGTTFSGSEWTIACEQGVVSVSRSTVTTIIGGKVENKEVQDERTGVPPEVRKWGEALVAGKQNERQRPEEALADLELVYMNLCGDKQYADNGCSSRRCFGVERATVRRWIVPCKVVDCKEVRVLVTLSLRLRTDAQIPLNS